MRKWLLGIAATILAIGMVGCKLTNEQVQVISQNAGLGATVTWIAYDNPDTNAINLINSVVEIIQDKAGSVSTGLTYTAVIYPDIQKYVKGQVPSQYKPIVLSGALAVLNGIDMLFAINPEWKEKEELALKSVQAFCFGVKQGLSLTDQDPVIIQARKFSEQRRELKMK